MRNTKHEKGQMHSEFESAKNEEGPANEKGDIKCDM